MAFFEAAFGKRSRCSAFQQRERPGSEPDPKHSSYNVPARNAHVKIRILCYRLLVASSQIDSMKKLFGDKADKSWGKRGR